MSSPQTAASAPALAHDASQIQPATTSQAPNPSTASKPAPAPSNKKKHTTQIQFDISNKTSLSDLAKRFNPATPAPEAPAPKLKSTYFEKLDIAVRMELDHGTTHIIDVQPDLRFPLQYILYNVTEQFPELTVKSHPFVSTFTLIAYQQILFNAYILICDIYSREVVSHFASDYKRSPSKMDFLTKLLDCYVPPDLEPLLNAFAPTYDPQKKTTTVRPILCRLRFRVRLWPHRSSQHDGSSPPPPCKCPHQL